MCLSKQEARKFTAGWASLMVGFLIQMGTGLWWASDMNRRVLDLEDASNKVDRFTQAEGDIHAFQIKQTLDVSTKILVTLEKIQDGLEQLRIFDKTHQHNYNGYPKL